jgi:hypothetical protein
LCTNSSDKACASFAGGIPGDSVIDFPFADAAGRYPIDASYLAKCRGRSLTCRSKRTNARITIVIGGSSDLMFWF